MAGGRVRVRVSSKDIHKAFPDTKIVIRAMNLHAPLIDRLLEIPMDIHEGAFRHSSILLSACLAFSAWCVFSAMPQQMRWKRLTWAAKARIWEQI